MKRALGVLAIGGVLIGATSHGRGGWAVVTFQDVPEYLEVGVPTPLEFKILQHGRMPLTGRSPSLTMHLADAGAFARFFGGEQIDVIEGSEPGLYAATVTATEAGHVRFTIDTDLSGWEARLLPMRVVPTGSRPLPLAAHERGRQLFAAKGCVTCHFKRDDPDFAAWRAVHAGPELTDRVFPRDWLAAKLADPAQFRGDARYNGGVMPRLELNTEEIDALVHFLNRGDVTEVSTRRGT